MLIATAGHVDHGKTSLVRSLTGIDTDRLPEEKSRGLTIDAGFAYHDLEPGLRVGFVDLPGHERFVRNMLAGVAAVDVAVLVVAADDGPMPQTHEHIDILRLLGIDRGIVVISKSDRADPARLDQVRHEVAAAVAGSFLASAPMLDVSSHSGAGIEAVRQALLQLCRQGGRDTSRGHFRLAVDRAFVVSGIGQVVTGAVYAGVVSVGDQLQLTPAGEAVRVRSLHVQDQPATQSSGRLGERCAIALTGVGSGKLKPARGDWLTGESQPIQTLRFDARLQALASCRQAVAHWISVRVHHGAASSIGRLAVLEGRSIKPGAVALVQLVLEQPLAVIRGDRFIVRDQSSQHTLGGGSVIDPFGAVRGRARPERLAMLQAMSAEDPAAALLARLAFAPGGVNLTQFRRGNNLTDQDFARIVAGAGGEQVLMRGEKILVASTRWQSVHQALGERVLASHRAFPAHGGPQLAELCRDLAALAPRDLVEAAVRSAVRQGQLQRRGVCLALPGHQPAPVAEDLELLTHIEPLLSAMQPRPPALADLARQSGLDKARLDEFLQRMALAGLLVRVKANRYFHPLALAGLAATAEDLAMAQDSGGSGSFDARAFREATGIGRNISIEVLEYFDAQRFTRRVENRRFVLQPAAEVFGPVK